MTFNIRTFIKLFGCFIGLLLSIVIAFLMIAVFVDLLSIKGDSLFIILIPLILGLVFYICPFFMKWAIPTTERIRRWKLATRIVFTGVIFWIISSCIYFALIGNLVIFPVLEIVVAYLFYRIFFDKDF